MTDKEKNLETIRQRKKNWIGHVLRGYGLFRNVLEERMLGKNSSKLDKRKNAG